MILFEALDRLADHRGDIHRRATHHLIKMEFSL